MVRRTLLGALIFFQALLGYSQQRSIDSLENLVITTPNDTTKVWLLNRLVTALREGDNNKALDHAQSAKELAEVLGYERGLGLALENLGWLSYRKGDYSKAFQLATQALAISEKFRDHSGIARCLNNIGAIYFEQKQYDVAVENFRKAQRIASYSGDALTIARSLNNIAYTMTFANQRDSALYYAERALYASRKMRSAYLEGYAYRTMGDVDIVSNRVKNGLFKFWRTLALAEAVDNKFLKVSTLHRVGQSFIRLNQPDSAVKYLSQNIEMANAFGYSDELEVAYKLMSEAYSQKNELQKAFEFQSQYVRLHDSLYDQRNGEQLALMQARFESALKEAEIELLKKDTQIKQQEINSQQIWMYFTIGVLSMTAIMAFVLLYSNWHKRKANRLLGLKNNEIQAQAIQLSNLNATKDKLLSIISHDVRGPLASLRGLINIICKGELTQQEFIANSVRLRHNLDVVQDDLDNLLYWSQSQLNGIRIKHEEIKIKSIIDEKVKLFADAADRKAISIINDVAEDVVVLADKNHLGLIVRNLLANAIKFNARGGSILIQDNSTDDQVEISIKDSGVGIDSVSLQKLFNSQTHFSSVGTEQEKGVGIGLLLTKEFIEKNGGSIWVTSEVGKGSTFTFTAKRASVSAGALMDN
jgi:signal transduction histidine kinase/Tfp pilus assembly protein PilF